MDSAAGERGPALSVCCNAPEMVAHSGVRKLSDMARSCIGLGEDFDYWDGGSSFAPCGSVLYVRGMQLAAWDAHHDSATHQEMVPDGA